MQETRAALIDAALELFAGPGGLDASLDAICERAGFTRGAFYVHFADRDALLVAVMEKVGATFLAQVFAAEAGATASPSSPPAGALEQAAARFIGAVTSGDYPLMATRATPKPQIRFHQLLDACARSPTVRAQYRALVEASIAHVAGLAVLDRTSGVLRGDLDPTEIGRAMLATIIGAQTMAELGVALDPAALARTMLAALSAPRARDVGA